VGVGSRSLLKKTSQVKLLRVFYWNIFSRNPEDNVINLSFVTEIVLIHILLIRTEANPRLIFHCYRGSVFFSENCSNNISCEKLDTCGDDTLSYLVSSTRRFSVRGRWREGEMWLSEPGHLRLRNNPKTDCLSRWQP